VATHNPATQQQWQEWQPGNSDNRATVASNNTATATTQQQQQPGNRGNAATAGTVVEKKKCLLLKSQKRDAE
jgi:hypothetical protein